MDQVLNFGATTVATATLAAGDLTLALTNTALLSGATPAPVVPTTSAPVVAVMFRQTYTNATAAFLNSAAEVVHITQASGTGMTIVRAQEGSTAISFVAGDYFTCPTTAGILQEIVTQFTPSTPPPSTCAIVCAIGTKHYYDASVKIDPVTHKIGASGFVGPLTGDVTGIASKVAITEDAGTHAVILGTTNDLFYDGQLTYNGTTNMLTSINFTGDLYGNIKASNGQVALQQGATAAGTTFAGLAAKSTLLDDVTPGKHTFALTWDDSSLFVLIDGTTYRKFILE